MVNIIDYLFFRIYNFFNKREKEFVMLSALTIIYAIELSLLIFLNNSINLFVEFVFINDFLKNNRDNKIIIVVIIAIILYIVNYIYFSPKTKPEYYSELEKKYKQEKYKLPIWIILASPVWITLICTIGYGAIQGTLKFSLLDRILN